MTMKSLARGEKMVYGGPEIVRVRVGLTSSAVEATEVVDDGLGDGVDSRCSEAFTDKPFDSPLSEPCFGVKTSFSSAVMLLASLTTACSSLGLGSASSFISLKAAISADTGAYLISSSITHFARNRLPSSKTDRAYCGIEVSNSGQLRLSAPGNVVCVAKSTPPQREFKTASSSCGFAVLVEIFSTFGVRCRL